MSHGGESGPPPARRIRLVRFALVAFALLAAGAIYLVNRPAWSARPITVVESNPDVDGLLVTVVHERCDASTPRVTVDDSGPATVVVRAEYDVSGDCDDAELVSEIVVDLDAPLGERTVTVDAASWVGSVECFGSGEPDASLCVGQSANP